MNTPSLFKRKLDYSWVIIALCFTMICATLGFCSSGRTMYLTAITDALSISRSAFSLSNTFRFLATTIVNLFFGKLVARYGTKKLICAGFLCLIAFALLSSVTETLLGFYVAGVLLGVGLSWTGTTMVSAVINKWCTSNKATLTGAVLAANGVGGAIAVQIISPIIFEEGNPFGYQASYRLVAVILAAVLLLIVLFYRNPASEPDEQTEAPKKKNTRGAGWEGMEFSEVLRKPYFYVVLACVFLTGMVLQGLGGITVPHMYDIGMDVDFVALLVSMSGFVLALSKFLTGYLNDRFGIKVAMNIALISCLLAMVMLIFMDNSPIGKIIAVIRTIVGTFAMPLETVMLPIFAAEFFGNKSFDKLIGIFVSVSSAGFAIGSPFGNLCYDIFGDYKIAFLIFSILIAIVTVALQFVIIASNRDRKRILAQKAE